MPFVTRRRVNQPARTESRYHPGDTPYPYKDCRKALRQLFVEAERLSSVDVAERSAAQVDLLRMALETIATTWLDADGELQQDSLINQRTADQQLARLALKHARSLDDDRARARAAGQKAHRVGKR
jgi:hypothetical protein